MKTRLLEHLVCPIDKTPLDLRAWESSPVILSNADRLRAVDSGIDPASLTTEIITGVLINTSRKTFYPIVRGVPRMLVFPTGVARDFLERYGDRIARELPGFELPDEKPVPGEETVLRTFSSEWLNYDWDGRSYWNYTPKVIYGGMEYMLDLVRRPVTKKLLLEVGIGVGGIADYITRSHNCELVGVDLSYAVDAAYRHFGKNVFFHIIQASVFAPPFRENTFDLVYSQGVLHHTFSTNSAFACIAELPKKGGRLYVWVYSPESEKRTLVRRGIMLLERVVRPICWRLPEQLQTAMLLPIIPLYLIHQNMRFGVNNAGHIKYGWREALHAARDRFTPRYAHRHTEHEVCNWFRENGYNQLQCAPKRTLPSNVPYSFVDATAVDGIRD